MKIRLLASLLFFSIVVFSQPTVTGNDKKVEKEISGFITHSKEKLANVNVVIKHAKHRGTKTNEKGFYSIKASVGEIIQFSYVGMKTIEIVVEDVTHILNIDMKVSANTLDEVTISAKRKKLDFAQIKKPKILKTSRGAIDTRKAGYGLSYVDGSELNESSPSLVRALAGKVPGLRVVTNLMTHEEFIVLRGGGTVNSSITAIWDIDGVIFRFPPPLRIEEVKDVIVLKSLAATNNYGAQGAAGVIVVRTKMGSSQKSKEMNAKSNPYINREYYKEDAISIKNIQFKQPNYLDVYDNITDAENAYDAYKNISKKYKKDSEFYMATSDYFLKKYNDVQKSEAILQDLEIIAASNPETLKAIAYTYQERYHYKKALNVYKKISKLRPNYAQSFRDLANAYVDVNDYPYAWKIYRSYLYKGNQLEENGIGEIMYREMEAIYTQKKKMAKIRENFVLKNKLSDIPSDVRLVFEWNTSEAEFALEFVNPQKQAYAVEHSLDKSEDLIFDEKLKGYSSKEFLINKLNAGTWLTNITYLGNKTYKPTYLKVTIYYNWAKPNQKQEIKLFKLTRKNLKIQLFKISTQNL